MASPPTALVLGAGIMGLSAAWGLARRGFAVRIVEQDAIPNPRGSSVDHHRLIRHAYGAQAGYMRMVDPAYAAWDMVWRDLGEVLHIRLRTGSANTSRGFERFLDELLARVARAGAAGPRLLRADSGFWSKRTFTRLDRAGWQFSIGLRQVPALRARIHAIAEQAWIDLPDYPKTSIAQIAETTHGGRTLVIRRGGWFGPRLAAA